MKLNSSYYYFTTQLQIRCLSQENKISGLSNKILWIIYYLLSIIKVQWALNIERWTFNTTTEHQWPAVRYRVTSVPDLGRTVESVAGRPWILPLRNALRHHGFPPCLAAVENVSIHRQLTNSRIVPLFMDIKVYIESFFRKDTKVSPWDLIFSVLSLHISYLNLKLPL